MNDHPHAHIDPLPPSAISSSRPRASYSSDFTVRNLSVLAYAQGFTLWHYRAPASDLREISAPGFFNGARDMFAAGDMLLISARDGGSVAFVAACTPGLVLAPMGGVT